MRPCISEKQKRFSNMSLVDFPDSEHSFFRRKIDGNFKKCCLQKNLIDSYPPPPPKKKKKITIFWGGKLLFWKGLILSWEIFYPGGRHFALGQDGSGARPVGRLHLSGRCYWAMNFKFFQFGAFFESFLTPIYPYPTCATKMNLLRTVSPYTSWKFVWQLIIEDHPMSQKTFTSNMMTSKICFRILKTEQKVKKWKDFVFSVYFEDGIFKSGISNWSFQKQIVEVFNFQCKYNKFKVKSHSHYSKNKKTKIKQTHKTKKVNLPRTIKFGGKWSPFKEWSQIISLNKPTSGEVLTSSKNTQIIKSLAFAASIGGVIKSIIDLAVKPPWTSHLNNLIFNTSAKNSINFVLPQPVSPINNTGIPERKQNKKKSGQNKIKEKLKMSCISVNIGLKLIFNIDENLILKYSWETDKDCIPWLGFRVLVYTSLRGHGREGVHKDNRNNWKVIKVMHDLNFAFEKKNLLANLCHGYGSDLKPQSGYRCRSTNLWDGAPMFSWNKTSSPAYVPQICQKIKVIPFEAAGYRSRNWRMWCLSK